MGYEKMTKQIVERHAEKRAQYIARIHAAGLAPLDHSNYTSPSMIGAIYGPATENAWQAHRTLLQREGGLTEPELAEISRGLHDIAVRKKEKELEERLLTLDYVASAIPGREPVTPAELRTVAGQDELRLMAMQELGFHDAEEYGRLFTKVSNYKHFRNMSAEELYCSRPMD